jgi:hypothetical protein
MFLNIQPLSIHPPTVHPPFILHSSSIYPSIHTLSIRRSSSVQPRSLLFFILCPSSISPFSISISILRPVLCDHVPAHILINNGPVPILRCHGHSPGPVFRHHGPSPLLHHHGHVPAPVLHRHDPISHYGPDSSPSLHHDGPPAVMAWYTSSTITTWCQDSSAIATTRCLSFSVTDGAYLLWPRSWTGTRPPWPWPRPDTHSLPPRPVNRRCAYKRDENERCERSMCDKSVVSSRLMHKHKGRSRTLAGNITRRGSSALLPTLLPTGQSIETPKRASTLWQLCFLDAPNSSKTGPCSKVKMIQENVIRSNMHEKRTTIPTFSHGSRGEGATGSHRWVKYVQTCKTAKTQALPSPTGDLGRVPRALIV